MTRGTIQIVKIAFMQLNENEKKNKRHSLKYLQFRVFCVFSQLFPTLLRQMGDGWLLRTFESIPDTIDLRPAPMCSLHRHNSSTWWGIESKFGTKPTEMTLVLIDRQSLHAHCFFFLSILLGSRPTQINVKKYATHAQMNFHLREKQKWKEECNKSIETYNAQIGPFAFDAFHFEFDFWVGRFCAWIHVDGFFGSERTEKLILKTPV